MLQKRLVQFLLLPFSLLYGLITGFRNWMYERGYMRSSQFDLPIIGIGNLSVGGTGKSPHIEYLIRLLGDYIQLGTLSRGYKRNTIGYRMVTEQGSAAEYGDEPLQFKRKFPEIPVAVAENRVSGVTQILMDAPDTQVILLDDAFQHRSIKPGLQIMLTDYNNLFTRDFLLPSGRLREWRSGYQRADIIIVSKCPENMTLDKKRKIIAEINPSVEQQIYFSAYKYGQPYYIFDASYKLDLSVPFELFLLSGIANTDYLKEYLEPKVKRLIPIEFEDHHHYSNFDIAQMKRLLESLPGDRKAVITTEKDAMRLEAHRDFLIRDNLPVFVLPIEVYFLFAEKHEFDQRIKDFLLEFKS